MRTIESLDQAFKMVKKFQMLDILDKEYKKDTRNFYTSIILLIASIFGCIFISPLFLFLAICGTGISIHGLIKTHDMCHQLDELENIKNTILGLRVNTINKHIQKRSLPK